MPRSNTRWFGIALLVALCCSHTAGAEEGRYLIRFQFQPKQTLRYKTTQKVTQIANTPKGVKQDVSTVDQVRVFTVDQVSEDGVADVRMQFADVRMTLKANDSEVIVFDASMPPSDIPPIFRETARGLKTRAPHFQIRETGTPVDSEGHEVVVAKGQASFMFPLPESEIAVGETWKVEIPVKVRIAEGVLREVKLLRSYRLESVESGIADISFATSIDRAVSNSVIKAQLIQSTPQGTIRFDLNRGVVLKRVLRFNRTVINALGTGTMLSAVGQTSETLVDADVSVSVR